MKPQSLACRGRSRSAGRTSGRPSGPHRGQRLCPTLDVAAEVDDSCFAPSSSQWARSTTGDWPPNRPPSSISVDRPRADAPPPAGDSNRVVLHVEEIDEGHHDVGRLRSITQAARTEPEAHQLGRAVRAAACSPPGSTPMCGYLRRMTDEAFHKPTRGLVVCAPLRLTARGRDSFEACGGAVELSTSRAMAEGLRPGVAAPLRLCVRVDALMRTDGVPVLRVVAIGASRLKLSIDDLVGARSHGLDVSRQPQP